MSEREIFLDALDRSDPTDRAAYLDRACGIDSELRWRVEALLDAHEAAGGFLKTPAPGGDAAGAATVAATADETSAAAGRPTPGPAPRPDVAATTDHSPYPSGNGSTGPRPLAEGPGSVIGPYKLLQAIGEGGMGTVFLAEQEKPVHRRVALKVIKAGMDSAQVVARFEAERQALALMDHPNIARVLDAGTTGGGRPYFVMELVHGVPITRYCDDARLTTQERLELFISVCQAIQHAHQKGIIHRDVKPSNVLVTHYDGKPVAKVIDFGVAKATEPRPTERTTFTQYGSIVGTPEYMSPEQAELSASGVDTRSDIYSLGALLYELLTGSTPLGRSGLHEAGYSELLKRIREVEPPKPSTRLGRSKEELPEISARRKTDPSRLRKLVRGELDWIVMKCLEKDRDRRYATANGLAMDLRRHLDDRPIEARRSSFAGRVRKFARRNRIPVALVGLALGAFVVAASFAVSAHLGRLREAELKYAILREQEQERGRKWAREFAIPQIRGLLDAGQPVSAFRLAQRAGRSLPDDPVMGELWKALSTTATLDTEPTGAVVAIRDLHAADDSWLEVGRTPLRDMPLPRGILRWRFAKPGHINREMVDDLQGIAEGLVRLPGVGDVPDDMVVIPPGHLTGWPGEGTAIGPFLIDRYEVTNRQYKRFMDAGGYTNRAYWKQQFVSNGETLSWDDAMAMLRDRTGTLGPSTWKEGRYPPGEGDYPVQGVSWYEAAAYAEFAGKSLPSLVHWCRAASLDQQSSIVLQSNFTGVGPAPVGRNRGIGRFDVYDMAGNVKEWCSNGPDEDGRYIMGGSWDEAGYIFPYPHASEPFARPATHGFRCASYLDPPLPALLKAQQPGPVRRRYEAETPASPRQLEAYRRQYMYDRDQPLNAQLVSRDEASGAYRHEVVRIDAAYGEEQFNINLFFPIRGRPPLGTVVYFPGGGSVTAQRLDLRELYDAQIALGLVAKGWALCWPVYKGTLERGKGEPGSPYWESVRGRDQLVQIAKDLSRSVDYLQSRSDIDLDHLVYCGFSWGAQKGPVMIVVEPRFKAAALIAGGHRPRGPLMPEVEPFQFAPYVEIPVLMINSRHDQVFLPEWHQWPFYEHLGTRDKKIVHLDSGHLPPVEDALDVAHEWLIEKLRDADEQ